MIQAGDDLRPRGTVQVECSSCAAKGEPGWYFWVACDDPRLPDGPFICETCQDGVEFGPTCQDCIAKAERGEIPHSVACACVWYKAHPEKSMKKKSEKPS